jgi:hypothetical protein
MRRVSLVSIFVAFAIGLACLMSMASQAMIAQPSPKASHLLVSAVSPGSSTMDQVVALPGPARSRSTIPTHPLP